MAEICFMSVDEAATSLLLNKKNSSHQTGLAFVFGWLVCWLVVCLVVCFVWLVGWLVGWLVVCLVGWLVVWLVGWLGVVIVVCCFLIRCIGFRKNKKILQNQSLKVRVFER